MKVNIVKHPTIEGGYWCEFRPDGVKGKRRRIPFPSYEDAFAYKSQLEAKVDGVGAKKMRPTIEMVYEQYLEWVKSNQSPSTYGDKVRVFKSAIIPHFGKYQPGELTQTVYDAFQAKLAGKRRAIIMYQDFLSALIKWMAERNMAELLTFKPSKPKYHAPKPLIPSMADIQSVIDYVADPTKKQLLITMLWTGLRWNEARLLRWEDVYLRQGFIRVRESDQEEEVHIPIYPEMQPWLETNKKKSGWLFSNPMANKRTKQLEPYTSFKTILETASLRLGIEIGHHDFRRRSAQNVYEASGFDIFAAQRHLRHKDIKTTMRYLGVDDQRRAQIMDNVLIHVENLRKGGQVDS
ncbi:tyrosine-type recombinase/integrase [Geomonas nitrogeniifigens]|uniref:tyrosine-type recombinase/integrase n=1 Tax=Geomonas diazotrophica TaxID=2843197 RepID=UPI001C2BF98E|nr:site-specific integrase [Geomonas nitrogeniifigens]QXE86013.1 tyrosine-type recombinase/integrase [Geomonas nitrogeniifigens]